MRIPGAPILRMSSHSIWGALLRSTGLFAIEKGAPSNSKLARCILFSFQAPHMGCPFAWFGDVFIRKKGAPKKFNDFLQ